VIAVAERVAHAEDTAIFHGFKSGQVTGIIEATPHKPVPVTAILDWPRAVVAALEVLRAAGMNGPYALALGLQAYDELDADSEDGYPLRRRLEESLRDVSLVWAPALQGGAHPLRAPAVFEDQAGPGEVDVLGALAAADRIRDPLFALPVRAQSWLTPSAEFYRADGSTSLQAILELRAAPTGGSAPPPADGFANDRLGAYALVDGKPFPGGVQSLDRRGPGVWVATVVLPSGLGGYVLTLGATFDGQPIVSEVSVPIAVDAWDAEYPATIPGGCSLARAGRRATPGGFAALLLAALAMLRVSRSRRRPLSACAPVDATGAADVSPIVADVSHQASHDPTAWRDVPYVRAMLARSMRHVSYALRAMSDRGASVSGSLALLSGSLAFLSGRALRLASRPADRAHARTMR